MWSLLRAILRVLQRPKVLIFLSVVTVFFFLNRSNDPVVLKAKVDFKGIKRSVSFEKGDLVLKLRYLIMVAFSDVGLNKVPLASVELLKYHHGVQDYVSLPLDKKLEDNIQVKMRFSYKQNGQSNSSNGPELYHPVIRNTPYRLWNPASTSLLQRDSNNVIRCNGSFKDMDYNTVAKTTKKGSTTTGFGLLFRDTETSKTYILNATNGGKSLLAVEHKGTIEKSMKFKPSYYWSFTVFKNSQYKTLYLGCGSDGELLLPMNSKKYPDPRTLFITNKYVPVGPSI